MIQDQCKTTIIHDRRSEVEGLRERENAVIALPRSGRLIRFIEID
jgi:hypothetical protein